MKKQEPWSQELQDINFITQLYETVAKALHDQGARVQISSFIKVMSM